MDVTLQMNFDLHLSWGHESVVSLPSTLAGPNYARPLNIFQVLCSSNLCIRGWVAMFIEYSSSSWQF